jgi:cell wall-associated NlpC family hydrolase
VAYCRDGLLKSRACDAGGPPVPAAVPLDEEIVIRRTRRQAFVVFLLALLAAAAFSGAASPSPVGTKRAEAQQVLAEIQSIDASLEHVIEAYNASQIKLDGIKAEQQVNARRLKIARSNYERAQTVLQERLVALYTSHEESALEVILGASSLSDLVDRLDAANRVSAQDARIVNEAESFRTEIKRREAELARAKSEQEQVIAEQAAKKATIESQLAERQKLLSSIRSEIERLKREEAEQQARLQAQAESRLNSSTEPAPVAGGGNPVGHAGGVVGIAMQYLGVPYVWGGASPSGFDCSGFTMYVFAQVGISLPHNAAMQYGYGSPVSRENLQPGDLVFFNGLGHMGLYIGGNQMIHAPHTGDVVKISSLTGWYAETYVGARRL